MGRATTGLVAKAGTASTAADNRPPPAEGELSAVKGIFSVLEKTSRVFQLYPADNKIFIDFTDELTERLQAFLKEHKELDLTIFEDRIDYRDRPVYEEENRAKSISMKLFRDGVRRIVLYDGLRKEEVLDLLDILTFQADLNSYEDDMVTLLWEKDFTHVSYFVLDDPFEEEQPPNLKQNVKQTEGREPKAGELRSDKFLAPKLSTRTLSAVLTIGEHDLEAVRAMIAQENTRNLRHDLTTLLFEMLNIGSGDAPFRNSIQILGRLARSYITSANLSEAVTVLAKFRELLRGPLPDSHRQIVEDEIDLLVRPEIMDEVGKLLEQPILKGSNCVTGFFRLLGTSAVPALISLLPRSKNLRVITALLAELGREKPEVLVEHLTDPDPTVVRHLIGVLGTLEDPALLYRVVPYLEHEDVAVRLETVRSIGRIGGLASTEYLLKAVRDPEYQVRIHALRSLSKGKSQEAATELRALIEDRGFLERNQYEKQEVYRTLARIDPANAAKFLTSVLGRTSFFRRAKMDETRASAATALGYIRTPGTRKTLEEFADSPSDCVREACQMAIRRLDREEEQRREKT